MNLVQIGVNVAYDDFSNIVKSYDKSVIENLILVEPIEGCHNQIKMCYDGYEYVLENCVINTDENKNTETFFISKFHWLSSLKESHIEKHKTNEVPLEKTVPSMTFNKLFEKYNLKKIDILFIDSEGMDDELIKSIDFNSYDIKTIYYEDAHINNESLIEFLDKKGYKVNPANFSDGLTSIAIKK